MKETVQIKILFFELSLNKNGITEVTKTYKVILVSMEVLYVKVKMGSNPNKQ